MKRIMFGFFTGVITACVLINMYKPAEAVKTSLWDEVAKYRRLLIMQEGNGWLVKKYQQKSFEIPVLYKKYDGIVIHVDKDWNEISRYHAGTNQLLQK